METPRLAGCTKRLTAPLCAVQFSFAKDWSKVANMVNVDERPNTVTRHQNPTRPLLRIQDLLYRIPPKPLASLLVYPPCDQVQDSGIQDGTCATIDVDTILEEWKG
ncbi:hypothetical protein ARMGADRAFT_1074988 [Armillaria gallica]|uniref:Uncharacterized protein n=1 Tax=Armillaria gallica TaxID=47427 RepID=A0A2H3DSC5_ARMGA|nr:hypothetical protein ARMGADRAFT_1074988 [Armillaria gallica]